MTIPTRSPHPVDRLIARRGGHLAATVAPTDQAVPPSHQGPTSLPELLVVYSGDRGIILTGYQIAGIQAVAIPEDARWLR